MKYEDINVEVKPLNAFGTEAYEVWAELDASPLIQSPKITVTKREHIEGKVNVLELITKLKDAVWNLYVQKHSTDITSQTDLEKLENGKYAELFKFFEIKKECMECLYFNVRTGRDHFRCYSPGVCVGATLSTAFKGLIFKKLLDKEKE
jgi:hypothetical protein